jgi:hypothetical protein
MFSRGDTTWDHNEWAGNGGRGMRGAFSLHQSKHWIRSRRVPKFHDGLSNSIAMSERTIAQDNSRRVIDGGTLINMGSLFRNTNPSDCATPARIVNRIYQSDVGAWAGRRWTDGAPAFTGFTTILGPNRTSCTQGGWDGEDGIYEPMSRHTGVSMPYSATDRFDSSAKPSIPATQPSHLLTLLALAVVQADMAFGVRWVRFAVAKSSILKVPNRSHDQLS